jgi:NAD(P)H dehydrogenase (quinone)
MNVLVVYYSRYGHVLKLAKAVREGIDSVEGATPVLRRAPEFPEEMEEIKEGEHSRPVWEEQRDVPECTVEDLRQAHAVAWGSPTRFGNMISQMKRVFDRAASLWQEGVLEGKPATVFTSTATTHGGQETTLMTMAVPLLHLGMILVGVPYSTPGMLHTEGRGGTPYGATTVAGQSNELEPTEEDLQIATAAGKRLAEVAQRLQSEDD